MRLRFGVFSVSNYLDPFTNVHLSLFFMCMFFFFFWQIYHKCDLFCGEELKICSIDEFEQLAVCKQMPWCVVVFPASFSVVVRM